MSLPGDVKPITEKQRMLLSALESKESDVVGAFGPSGTGKSFITCLYGIQAIKRERFSRLVIARPIVDIDTGRRYSSVELGELYFKLASSYLYDILSGFVSMESIDSLIEKEEILIVDPSFLSGRTFDNTLLFLDDAQFLPSSAISESFMRVGEESKLVIAGDPIFQAFGGENSAALARELIIGEDKAIVVDFGVKDIVRPGAKKGFRLALEMKLRRRNLNEEERRIRDIAYAHAPDADIVTVFQLRHIKDRYKLDGVPDALIISKEDFLGRLIGRGGERIRKIEEDSGLFIRAVELREDLRDIVTALHPLGWIEKHIRGIDIIGPNLEIEASGREYGAFIGQRGIHVRFLDDCLRELLGLGVRVRSVDVGRSRRRHRS